MALVLQLLPLLLSRAQGNPGGKPSQESRNGRGKTEAGGGGDPVRVVGGMRCVWEDPGWREGRGEGKGVRGRGVLLCGLALTTVPRNPPPPPPPLASLDGHPGDRVNLSCVGVSQPTRWVWAPRFPACKGLSKGRRAILLASPNGTPTVSPVQPFAGRLRALDLDIRRLELLLSAGDSGTFICKGRQENESRTELHVLGDRAYCRAPGPTHGSVYPQTLIPLLGAGLVLGLGVLGWACWLRSSIRESGAPEASRGGRAQDCRGPGPGAEPALRRPGSYGPQKILPTVPSGPCGCLHHLCGCSSKGSPYYLTSWGLPALHNTPPLLGPSPGKGRHHGIEMSTRLGVRRRRIQAISAADFGPHLSHSFQVSFTTDVLKPDQALSPYLKTSTAPRFLPSLPFSPQSSSLNQGPTPVSSIFLFTPLPLLTCSP
nr:megakaryocyte and platelet inhibitory receptor G6b isoform X2 [Globicephala melas]